MNPGNRNVVKWGSGRVVVRNVTIVRQNPSKRISVNRVQYKDVGRIASPA